VLATLCALSVGAQIVSYLFSIVLISLAWVGLPFIYLDVRMVALAVVGYYGYVNRIRLTEMVLEKVDVVQTIKNFIERAKYATKAEKIKFLRWMDKRAKNRRKQRKILERTL